MGRKRTPGLRKRRGIWHIDKIIFGRSVHESCRTGSQEEAEKYLARKIEEMRRVVVYGERPRRTFREAASRYLREHMHKASIADDAIHLRQLDAFIGELSLAGVHDATLQPFVDYRLSRGIKRKSINLALGVARRILNLSARSWRDDNGLTWLETSPMITLLPVTDAAKPYPLSWEEQSVLFKRLPDHLHRMALYKVNTGSREQEVCQLRWEWEVPVPELQTSVFIIPEGRVKNRDERLIVLNDVARSVIEGQRGKHKTYVFAYEDRCLGAMNNTAWKHAWRLSGLPVTPQYRRGVHNLKHTFGRRLRAAGVPNETRKVLLGHRNGDITTHYSAAELKELLDAANRVCRPSSGKNVAITLLRQNAIAG